jgi:predicted nucleic acid-binding protein
VKLVVDASVVVKWFVEEDGHAEALAIFERGDECFAPDLVVVEVAGALDKKIKAGTIDSEQAFEAIGKVQSEMTMVAGSRLIERALDLASELNHPVADCLYLACAIEIDACVVSADKLFVERAHARGYLSRVYMLGNEGRAIARKLSVKISELERIKGLYDQVDKVFLGVSSALTKNVETFLEKAVSGQNLKPAFDSPAYQRLVIFLDALSYDARCDVIALCWLGRDYNKETWEGLRAHAASFDNGHLDTGYFISKLAYLTRGLEWLQAHVEPTKSDTHG